MSERKIQTGVSPYVLEELKPLSFVWRIRGALPADVCREAIRRFEEKKEQQYLGRVGQTAEERTSIKQSTDLAISGKDDWKDIDTMLHRSLGLAIREFRECFGFFKGPFRDVGYNLQRTEPGQYYHWHIDGGSHDFADRQLVAVWYLNDVPGPGGETEFLYQDLKVEPEEGTLILFPPFWTHEHRGVTLEQGMKYIATTWVVFA
ncbi:MAG: 2OG-Fe(II) oxygenase [Acidiferrobacteraceae bacterium]|jgi:hypothetical protein